MNLPKTQDVATCNESSSSESTSLLLSKIGLIALVVILLIAAWNGQVFIVILLGLAVSAAVLGKLWSRFSLRGVGCGRTVSEDRVFAGETVELKVRLANRKILPLPWVQLRVTTGVFWAIILPCSGTRQSAGATVCSAGREAITTWEI